MANVTHSEEQPASSAANDVLPSHTSPLRRASAGTKEDSSPGSSQAIRSPGGLDVAYGLAISDAEKTRARGAGAPDPLVLHLRSLSACRSVEEVHRYLFPPDGPLLEGMKNERSLRMTILGWLESIHADERTHRQLALDPMYTLREVTPSVFADAVLTMARSQGWSAECLHACLRSNLSWLENPDSRLRTRPGDTHSVNTDIPVFIGQPVSTKKSSMVEYTKHQLLVANPKAPKYMKDVFHNDGTLKAQRLALQTHRRLSLSSDEVTATYDCGGWSEKEPGIHFVNRNKINTFTQGEADDSMVAAGATNLSHYRFQHKAIAIRMRAYRNRNLFGS